MAVAALVALCSVPQVAHAATADPAAVAKVTKLLRSDPKTPAFVDAKIATCIAQGLVDKYGSTKAIAVASPNYDNTPDDDVLTVKLLNKCVPAPVLDKFFGDAFASGLGTAMSVKAKSCLGAKVRAKPELMSGDATAAAGLLRACLSDRELTAALKPQFATDPTMKRLTATELECVVPKAVEVGISTKESDPSFGAKSLAAIRSCLSVDRLLAVFVGSSSIAGLSPAASACVMKAVLDKVPADQLAKLGSTDRKGTGLSPVANAALSKAMKACAAV